MPRGALFATAAVVAAVLSFAAAVARPGGGDRDAAALDGASLFATKGCATCHDGPDGPSLTDAGPSLGAAPSWAGARIEGVQAADYVEQSMRNPSALISPAAISGASMPVLQLSDDEIDALVEYLLRH